MAFQVKDLMIALDPSRMACGAVTESQCPTASATLRFCGTLSMDDTCPAGSVAMHLTCGPVSVDTTQCSGVSAAEQENPDSQRRLETLRRQLAAALAVN